MLTLSVALAGCATTAPPTVVARPLALPIPVCPTLTPIPASAFVPISAKMRAEFPALAAAHVTLGISDATYSTLVYRERAERTCAAENRAVIETNNAAAAKQSPGAKR